jgi:hypothetical protein
MVPIPAAIMEGFPPSTPSPRCPLFTPNKAVVYTGFAVCAGYGENTGGHVNPLGWAAKMHLPNRATIIYKRGRLRGWPGEVTT